MTLATQPETVKKAASQGLVVESVLDYIRPGGRVAQYLKGFEAREQQQAMMRNVVEAYNDSHIALVEAGTGTGKSMAYLIPAILWAAKYGKRTVISTHTITLQEQLVEKDIPMLINALGLQVKAVLVKGMGNYVCLRKHDQTQLMAAGMVDREREELAVINGWLPTSQDGSKADMPIVPSRGMWEQIGAEPDTCNWQKCPFHKACYFVKARAKAAEAQILVVNHHLLFADLSKRAQDGNYTNPAVLPAYDHIIIDEAHNIEDVATEYFASRLSRLDSSRLMARLASDRTGRLTELRQAFMEGSRKKNAQQTEEMRPIVSALNMDIPGQRRDLIQTFGETFQAVSSFLTTLDEASRESESESEIPQAKLRLLPQHLEHPYWKENIAPRIATLVGLVGHFTSSIESMLKAMEKLPQKDLLDRTQGIRYDISALSQRLTTQVAVLQSMGSDKFERDRVRWIENYPSPIHPNVHLVDASLDVSTMLREFLFEKFSSVVLCSATMTVNKKFTFLRERLGLEENSIEGKAVDEHIYESPFAYEKQAMLVVPTDMPLPSDNAFFRTSLEGIWTAITASQGNALVLFTSYQMLNAAFQQLSEPMTKARLVGLKQGDDSRSNLLQQLRNTKHAVLFATYSFWEGVDISGDALRCVIIVKLPFKVPTEPLIQARTENIAADGGDPFRDYSLPLAIVKFKQGFGRLIRGKRDRGCIVCLDSRLLTKNYGQSFLNSLPDCQRLFVPRAETKAAMQEFYRKTHHYTVDPQPNQTNDFARLPS